MPLFSNVVWPSLLLSTRLWAPWIIAVSLVVEWIFVIRLTRCSYARAALMTFTMNAISTLLGSFFVPISGFIWELIASVTVYPLLKIGTFNPITWGVSTILAAVVNGAVESSALKGVFKVPWSKRLFWWLVLANVITAALALYTIIVDPPKL